MKTKQVSPLATLHIVGQENAMTDIPSRSSFSTLLITTKKLLSSKIVTMVPRELVLEFK
jgi:hypothetical protein